MAGAGDTIAPYGATDAADRGAAQKAQLKAAARALGLADLAVTDAAPLPRGDFYEEWLARGCAGEMRWLEPGGRGRPELLLPGARTLIVAALRYARPPREPAPIAAYATRADYHLVLKRALRQLSAQLRAAEPGSATRVTVDTAPLREREAAMRAGLGWIGKNTMLVHPRHGCWTLLGTVLWTGVLPPDPPAVDHCGECRRCLDACPTGAFPQPYQLDPRRCLSYWTIEQQGPLPEPMREALAGRAFGCDACLDACPFGSRASAGEGDLLPTDAALAGGSLRHWLVEARARFWKWFRHTPVARARRRGFLRNLLAAAGSTRDATLRDVVAPFCQDGDPLLAEQAHWTLARLAPEEPA